MLTCNSKNEMVTNYVIIHIQDWIKVSDFLMYHYALTSFLLCVPLLSLNLFNNCMIESVEFNTFI